jgi:arginyl-tRNA synthetase
MMSAEEYLTQCVQAAVHALWGAAAESAMPSIQRTRADKDGDYTMTAFGIAKTLHAAPAAIAQQVGAWLLERYPAAIERTSAAGGFLNITLKAAFYLQQLQGMLPNPAPHAASGQTCMVEFSSPNTNKPLHLGHIRNNLLGCAVSNLLQAAGHAVIKVNLVNDRGIHICKSMLAWQRWGNGAAPDTSATKGDHLVGAYYVLFDKKYKEELAALQAQGFDEEQAKQRSALMRDAQQMLRQWEQGDAATIALWERMNGWVYEGFQATYRTLGVDFDKTYYESQTYLLGKRIVAEGLERGVFYQKDDGSVWIDLTDDGLDHKLVQRADGTSVYITQDIGTAVQRFAEHRLSQHIYVVGSEQDYHFQVLKLILHKLGCAWADSIRHLSYGMVELPDGRMKSREGTVVDADDLLEQMFATAREMAQELGKLDDMDSSEREQVVRAVGLGALKYFILKVDPQRGMLFNPRQSIDFNGNTGPFIQYTYARIRSVLRKACGMDVISDGMLDFAAAMLSDKEKHLIMLLDEYAAVVHGAAAALSPALVANYAYELAKEYNQFYHDYPILKEESAAQRSLRLRLCEQTAAVIEHAMSLLGIEVVERM